MVISDRLDDSESEANKKIDDTRVCCRGLLNYIKNWTVDSAEYNLHPTPALHVFTFSQILILLRRSKKTFTFISLK
jgi:hypothetical protein